SINYLDYGTWFANANCGTEPYYYQWYLDKIGDNDAAAQIGTGQQLSLKSVAAGTSQQQLITTETIESPTIMGPSNYTTFNLSLKISDDNGYYRWVGERTITAYGDVDLIQSYDPGNPTPFSMTAYSTTEQTGYVTIYPNPANEELTIRSLSDSSIDLILYDEQSNIIFKGKLNNKDIVWNTSNLDEGIYYLHIYKGDELTKRQILIEHK
ncbi:MAG: T9SS type A sorting domain-containing protein, partial [Flavobacteriales bacterium]|nr:T9SS type A sorting domain-containing protein [Flavobacteriales bacterium]